MPNPDMDAGWRWVSRLCVVAVALLWVAVAARTPWDARRSSVRLDGWRVNGFYLGDGRTGRREALVQPGAIQDGGATLVPAAPVPSDDPEAAAAEVKRPAHVEARDAYQVEVVAPYLDLLQRVTRYVRAMGFRDITDEEIRDCCDLAHHHGYDPRLWAVVAMAESSGGNGSNNLYGFCGGPGSPWARPSGGWREQTEYLDDRITTFYSQYVDVSDPAQVLWFHHEGEPLYGRDPHSVFYVHNIMTWLESI